MPPHKLRQHFELLAADTLERVARGETPEYDLVELKRDWIDPPKAARRIAAHANSARGEDFLWLIGVDEKQGVVGCSAAELAAWLPAVNKYFHGEPPTLLYHFPVPAAAPVTALVFDSSAAPFLVTNTRGTPPPELEVPWRYGTTTRSADRRDLLRILVPRAAAPIVEILSADAYDFTKGSRTAFTVWAHIASHDARKLIVRHQDIVCTLKTPAGSHISKDVGAGHEPRGSATVYQSQNDIHIDGAGTVAFYPIFQVPLSLDLAPGSLAIAVSPLGCEVPGRATIELAAEGTVVRSPRKRF